MNQINSASKKPVWKIYAQWFFINNLAFLITYPFCNWITSWRTHTVGLYLNSELSIPFKPEFIWAYFSVNLLFIWPPFFLDIMQLQMLGKRLLIGTLSASVVFLIIPTHLGFSRIAPIDPLYQSLFSGLFFADKPHNLVPSLHVIYSALTIFAYTSVMTRMVWRIIWFSWLILIMTSTVLVHQHHLMDVFMGLLVAIGIHFSFKNKNLVK
jgi:PAP2 superfamily.